MKTPTRHAAPTPTPSSRSLRTLACNEALVTDSWAQLAQDVAAAQAPLSLPGLEVERELGRGGMGVVYLARQAALNRLVAVKMLRHSVWATPKERLRFQREAEAMARLHHPHIVQVYELNAVTLPVEGEQPYMVLEYVPGTSLERVLGGKPLSPAAAARVALHLAEAVQAAHDQGILHRDLKPGNVLLALRGDAPEPRSSAPADGALVPRLRQALAAGTCMVKLTDFGLARFGPVDLTTAQVALGTPAYMAPEQALANGELTPAVDVYGLGAILYEMLTAHTLYQGCSAVEVFQQLQDWEPVSPRQLRPVVPRDLDTICLKCLQKRPHQRYASAAALADDLRRFLDGQPITARPVTALERTWRWCRRQPMVASLAVGILLLLVLSSAVAWSLAAWALGEKDRADAQTQQAQENLAFAQTEARRADAQTRQAEANLAEARRAVDECFRLAEQDPLFQSDALREQRRRLLQAALPYYRRFREQARQNHLLTAEQAALCGKLAAIAHVDGDARQALAWSLEACDLLRNLAAQEPANLALRAALAQAQVRLVPLHSETGNSTAALETFRHADETLAQLLQAHPQHPDYTYYQAKNWSTLGYLHVKQGRIAQALPWLEKAVPAMRRLAAANPGDVGLQREVTNVGISLSMVYVDSGRKEDAAPLAERTKVHAETLSAAHPDDLGCLQDLTQAWSLLSYVAMARGQHREALHCLEQARRGSERQLGLFPRHAELVLRHAELLLGLSNAQVRLGNSATALDLLAEVQTLHRRLQQAQPGVPDHAVSFAAACCNRGILLRQLHRYDEALAEFTQAETALRPVVNQHPDHQRARQFLFNTLASRAEVYMQQQHFAEAAREWQLAATLAPATGLLTVRIRRIIALSLAQDHEQAVTEAAALAAEPGLNAATLVNLARVQVLAMSGLPSSDPRRDQRLRAALDLLRQAKAKGYANWKSFQEDPDMAPLRACPEWRELVPAP